MATLSFDQGTLLLDGFERMKPPGFIWDERVGAWRSEGFRYHEAVLWLRRQKIPFTDRARQYDPNKLHLKSIAALQLFDYQRQAVLAWRRSDQRAGWATVARSRNSSLRTEDGCLSSRPGALSDLADGGRHYEKRRAIEFCAR